MIQIGTVIQGYKVYGICDKYCIARNISPRTADSWVVWTINNNQKGDVYKRQGIWCFDGSVGIVFDHKGNIALQNTKGVGIGSGTPSISGGFFKSQYWTDDFKKLEGGGAAIGGSRCV